MSAQGIVGRPVPPRWVTVVAAGLVAVISLLAFAVSFAALRDLAARSGIPGGIAWAWPLIVDGSIVTAMLVIFAWRGRSRSATAWPWVTLLFFAAVSVVGNGVHTAAVLDPGSGVALPFAIFIGALPPVGLLLSSEMLVRLLAGSRGAAAGVPPAGVTPPPAPSKDEVSARAVVDPSEQAAPSEPRRPAPVPVVRPQPLQAPATAPTAHAAPRVPAVPSGVATPQGAQREARVPDADTGAVVELPTAGSAPTSAPRPASNRSVDGDIQALEGSIPAHGAESSVPSPVVPPLAATSVGLPRLRAVESIPSVPAGQVEWILAQARAGRDVSVESIREQFTAAGIDISPRTVRRRLADARDREPGLFAAADGDVAVSGASTGEASAG